MIQSLILDVLVRLLHQQARSTPGTRPALRSRKGPLPPRKTFFARTEVLRVRVFSAVRQRRECCEPHIDAGRATYYDLFRGFAEVAGETNVPSVRHASDRDVEHLATKKPVFVKPYQSKFRNAHVRVATATTLSLRRHSANAERVVAVPRLEAWIAWHLADFYALEEGLESVIHTPKRRSCNARWDRSNRRIASTKRRQFQELIIERWRRRVLAT